MGSCGGSSPSAGVEVAAIPCVEVAASAGAEASATASGRGLIILYRTEHHLCGLATRLTLQAPACRPITGHIPTTTGHTRITGHTPAAVAPPCAAASCGCGCSARPCQARCHCPALSRRPRPIRPHCPSLCLRCRPRRCRHHLRRLPNPPLPLSCLPIRQRVQPRHRLCPHHQLSPRAGPLTPTRPRTTARACSRRATNPGPHALPSTRRFRRAAHTVNRCCIKCRSGGTGRRRDGTSC